MTTLYNANLRSAYWAGFYGGSHRIGDLLRHGDFGFGALDHNDGELSVLDGRAFRTAYDGTTHEVAADTTTPYATVLPFAAATSTTVSDLDQTAFERRMAQWLPLGNRIWALRVHGRFSVVESGAGRPQQPPYRPMAQVIGEYAWIAHPDTVGTLVGFSCPDFLLGQNRVGFHYHWLSDDLTQGGHVVDFAIADGTVEAAEATTFTLDVATDETLHTLDLTPTN